MEIAAKVFAILKYYGVTNSISSALGILALIFLYQTLKELTNLITTYETNLLKNFKYMALMILGFAISFAALVVSAYSKNPNPTLLFGSIGFSFFLFIGYLFFFYKIYDELSDIFDGLLFKLFFFLQLVFIPLVLLTEYIFPKLAYFCDAISFIPFVVLFYAWKRIENV